MNNKTKDKGLSYIAVLFITAGIAFVLGFAGFVGYRIHLAREKDRSAAPVIEAPVINEAADTDNNPASDLSPSGPAAPTVSSLGITSSDVSGLVECAMPAVVSIECTVEYVYDSFWMGPMDYEGTSGGSGFLISQDGSKLYIATNNHVIEDSTSITVTLSDGTQAEAQVVGSDAYYDLAVICVDISSLTEETLKAIRIASIGSSDNLNVGSMVVAIGNSLGYGLSTTVGYVSALNREIEIDTVSRPLIQTDAAINPGNSGGPLLNAYGQVVGINSAKMAAEDIEGMGYAIPISDAVPIINDLISYLTLTDEEAGYLGIEGQDISQSYASGFNMPLGIYICAISEGSPADAADICVGDIITGINGRKVTTMNELINRLNHIRAGETVNLTIMTLSGGRYNEKTVPVTLGNRPEQ